MPHITGVREEAGHVGSQEGSETERPESETTTGWSERKEGAGDEREWGKKKRLVDPKQDMPLIFFWHSLFIFQVSSPSALKLSSINLCI